MSVAERKIAKIVAERKIAKTVADRKIANKTVADRKKEARTKESTLNEIANLFFDEYNTMVIHFLYHVHAAQ